LKIHFNIILTSTPGSPQFEGSCWKITVTLLLEKFFKRFLLSHGSLQTINQTVYNCSIHQLEIPFELVSRAGDLCYSGSNSWSSENCATQWKNKTLLPVVVRQVLELWVMTVFIQKTVSVNYTTHSTNCIWSIITQLILTRTSRRNYQKSTAIWAWCLLFRADNRNKI
jgi:hypothetical protein